MNKLKGSLVQFNSLKQFYPVGYILINASDKFDPNKFIPGTKWKKLPEDTYIVSTTENNLGFNEKESLIVDSTNIEAFTQETEKDGSHSHTYYRLNWRFNDSHGSQGATCRAGEEGQSFSATGSEHKHTVVIGKNKPININNFINHTKLNIWLRIK